MFDHLRSGLNRRQLLRWTTMGAVQVASAPWFSRLAHALANHQQRKRHCILLWMSGGPSQLDTFDMKPNHASGGEFREVATAVPGIRFSEHLPQLAQHADQLAIVRGVSTREGDHVRGTYLMRTGRSPGNAAVRYPAIGAALSKELGRPDAPLPNYVSINPNSQVNPDAFGPGFLGPQYAPAVVEGDNPPSADQDTPPAEGAETDQSIYPQLRVENLQLDGTIEMARVLRRQRLWDQMQQEFLASRKATAAVAQDTVYRRALQMMTSQEVDAFDLTQEPDQVRARYGATQFGQGCLLARRLIERGVPFVEVALGAGLRWDTHEDNFNTVRELSAQLDAGWATLLAELQERGLLQQTTILWMGEFGRTPRINNQGGRDHFPNAWTCVFAGGGIGGGQVYGRTTPDGMEVAEGKVSEADVLATLCQALGVDPETENVTELGRPHKIAEGQPIRPILS